jgi:hypothetical protein
MKVALECAPHLRRERKGDRAAAGQAGRVVEVSADQRNGSSCLRGFVNKEEALDWQSE